MPRKTREQKTLELAKLSEEIALEPKQPDDQFAFSSRIFSLASLPVRRYTAQTYYRKIGTYDFYARAGMDVGKKGIDPNNPPMLEVPWGVNARRILIWMDSEVIRTKDNVIHLGKSFADFMIKIGIPSSNLGGSERKPLIQQLKNVLGAQFVFQKRDLLSQKVIQLQLAESWEVWFDSSSDPDQLTLDEGIIVVSPSYAKELAAHGVPLDARILRVLSNSPLGLDFYRWLSYKAFQSYRTEQELRIPMKEFLSQLGADYEQSRDLKRDLKEHLQAIKSVWSTLDCTLDNPDEFILKPCLPSVALKELPKNMSRKL